MDRYYEKLEELIEDEDKIVTVPSFAWETKLSKNEALSIINKFVQCHKDSGEILFTYTLAGKKKDDEKFSVLLVRHENLKGVKELFEDGVDVSIFSIQKAKTIDYNVIGLIDSQIKYSEGIISGCIVGENCKKRVLQKKQLPTLPAPKVRGKSSFFTKQNKAESVDKVVKKEDDSEHNQNKQTQPNSITSMFNKANQNKVVEQKDEKPNNTKLNANKDGKKNSIMSLFAKQAQKKEIKTEEPPKKETNNQDSKESVNIKKKLSNLVDSDTDEDILKDIDMNEEKEQNKMPDEKKEVVKENVKNSKKRQAKTGTSGSKKRRRIIVENDSDSDIFASDKSEDEDIIEKSDEEPEPVKPLQLPTKARRRKAVDKTYQDGEYIVTKTEYVYETASEDESEPVEKPIKTEEKPKITKNGSSSTETDVSPNKGDKKAKGIKGKKAMAGNQTSLKNFFKPK
ncbi:hypothetical protein GWI33_016581 [Rhynchophorus ferrugineus]|uniref:DNA polymerase delta subunit 3 n=1 Tax=Rhynchophorus ferrugineus TaxID=354439 RepID=A0A834M357_RHYFE|nr:hypothetical protein GWI33_016581 [Rhynchophorus ferrugineus]